jgi:hypothetical protein
MNYLMAMWLCGAGTGAAVGWLLGRLANRLTPGTRLYAFVNNPLW